MNILQIHHFSFGIYNLVFDFLHSHTQHAYALVSKNFNYQFKMFRPWAEKTEKYILEHYNILGCYPFTGNLKFFLLDIDTPLSIMCSETHTRIADIFLNSTLCNALYSQEMDVLIEGGATSVNNWKQEKSYVFSYLRPEIIETVSSWDLDLIQNEEGSHILREEIIYVSKMIVKCQEVFRFYLDEKNWCVEKFFSLLDQTCEEDETRKCWMYALVALPNCEPYIFQSKELFMKTFSFIAEHSEEGKKFAMELLIRQALYTIFSSCESPGFKDACEEIHWKRDKRLLDFSISSLIKNRDCFVVAGGIHVKKIYKIYKRLLPINARYLFLAPKNEIHLGKIHENIYRIFYDIETGSSDEGIEELGMPLDYTQQIERLLDFNVENLDYDINHYGLWTSRVRELIVLQLKKSNQMIAEIADSLYLLLKKRLNEREWRATLAIELDEFLPFFGPVELITDYADENA